MTTIWNLVAETKEWVGPITVTVNDSPVSSFEVSVCDGASRPTTWEAATVEPGGSTDYGVLVGTGTSWGLTVGHTYTIFVRYTSSPEIPIVRAGKIKAT